MLLDHVVDLTLECSECSAGAKKKTKCLALLKIESKLSLVRRALSSPDSSKKKM